MHHLPSWCLAISFHNRFSHWLTQVCINLFTFSFIDKHVMICPTLWFSPTGNCFMLAPARNTCCNIWTLWMLGILKWEITLMNSPKREITEIAKEKAIWPWRWSLGWVCHHPQKPLQGAALPASFLVPMLCEADGREARQPSDWSYRPFLETP